MDSSLAAALQSDCRQLISDSKRTDGLGSQISGFFSTPENPVVKEAAERAILKLRSCAGPQELSKIRESPDILRPFLLACETKNHKLVINSLGCVQRLLANDAVAMERVPDVLSAMHQAEKLGDETIKLKLLQTALTLLQSKLGITDEGSIGISLGICFRILAQSRNTDSVLSTAAAAVRQGVAVVFERFEGKIRESSAPQAAGGGGAGAAGGTPGVAQHDTAAVEKLLEDIIDLVNGKPAAWLSVSHLQRSFALDLLELVVSNSSLIFHTQAALQAQLQSSVSPYVVQQLSDGFAADSSHVMDAGETRQLLRIACPLLLSLHGAIPESTAPLVHVILQGASSSGTLWQRSQALKVLRQLCADPKVLLHLQRQHVSQADATPGSEDPETLEAVDIVREMVECFAETALSYMKLVAPEDPTLGFLAALYSHKAASGMHVDAFHESMMANGVGSVEEAGALLAMQAVDCMLAMASSFDSLADKLVVAGEPEKEAPVMHAGKNGREDLPCLSDMVDTNWKRILSTLFEVLSRTDGESLVLSLVRGYQLMIQTCGAVGADDSPLPEAARDRLTKARDGFLSSLCEFTLSSDRDLRAYLLDASLGSSAPGTPSSNGGGSGFKEKMAGMGETLAGMSQRIGRSGSGHLAGAAAAAAAASSGGHNGRDKQDHHHPHQGGLPQGDSDARVLTPKNVQCMRALFNCAHRLCCSLGTSWAIVLSNLVSLDRILQSPHTTTLEISAQTDTSLSADLAILQAAANQLFESTADLPTEVVLGMMASLRDISTRMLSDAAMRPSHVRLFALERLVETLLVNCHRVQDLWGVFLTHILEVVNTDPGMFRKLPLQVRAAGMDALDRATMGILTTTISWRPGEDDDDHESPPEFQRASGPSFSPSKLEGPISDEQSMALERMVLLPLEELYKQAREVDVRLGVLRIVMHCLQQHGDHLRTGWSPILRLLREVPARDEADVLALAFQSVQLLSSEYMAMFPEELQIGCIQVATMYASQQTDLNISLTSIGLLWNTADLMATTLAGTKDKESSEERSSEPAAALGAGEVQEDLLQSLFSALQRLSSDTRPEVRNSAVRTLFRVMSSTGERLAPTTWENCLWGLLFPLMNQTSHMSATSCREENEAAELGKEKGRSVKMLVHHSRNSEQKQWDETLVLVLNGMGRLLRVFLPTLARIPRISEAWDDIMQVVETTMMSSRKELAMASISMLSSILQSPEACNAMSPSMWKRAMTVFANGAQEAAARPQAMPLQARTELVTALEALYTVAPSRFDDADATALLQWSSAMMRNPHAPGDGPVGAGVLPPLQKVVLRAMESIAPQLVTHHPELCTNLLDTLILLFPRHPRDPLPETPSDEAADGGVPGTNPAALQLLQERALALIITLYKQHAPWRVRASRFGPVVLALGNCMVTRWQPLGDIPDAEGGSMSSGGMWRAASRALVAVVNAGLPAVNIAYVNSDTSDPPDEVWDALLSAFGGFLIGPEIMGSESSDLGAPGQQVADCFGEPDGDGAPADAAKQLSEDIDLEAAVLDSLTDGVLPGAVHAPEECKKRLVQIVEMGVARGPKRRPALLGSHGKLRVSFDGTNSFPQLCLRKLFVLCSRGVQAPGAHGTMLEVACLTLPMLLSTCSSILTQYISDENALPSDRSMPRARYDLVMCMLEVVSSLKVAPCVVDAAVEGIGSPRLAMLLAACREARGGGGGGALEHQVSSSDPWSITPPGTPSAGQGLQTQQEATHLLILYPELVKGVTARDARIRESIASMLAEVGSELGLVAPAAPE